MSPCAIVFAQADQDLPPKCVSDNLPAYALQFSQKLNIDKYISKKQTQFYADIKSAAVKVGMDNFIKTAKNATDTYTGGKYFEITENADEILIEKHYVLDDVIVVYTIRISKTKDGKPDELVFYTEYIG